MPKLLSKITVGNTSLRLRRFSIPLRFDWFARPPSMQAQPCFCAGVVRFGRDFGFDTGPSWHAMAHAPGARGTAAARELSIRPVRCLRVCWRKQDKSHCSAPLKFTETMFQAGCAPSNLPVEDHIEPRRMRCPNSLVFEFPGSR